MIGLTTYISIIVLNVFRYSILEGFLIIVLDTMQSFAQSIRAFVKVRPFPHRLYLWVGAVKPRKE